MSDTPFSADVAPDWEGFIRCIRREGTPDRTHYIELFLDGEIQHAIAERYGVWDDIDPDDPQLGHKRQIALQRFLGYDFVRATVEGLPMPLKHSVTEDTAALRRENGRSYMELHRGPITNWAFFVVMYTIVAVNRDVILEHAAALVPVVLVSVSVTFLLGFLVYVVAVKSGAGHEDGVSLTLIFTLKNYALAGGVAMTFLSDISALPAAVQTGVMILYIIWLDRFFRKYRPDMQKKLDK